MQQSFFAYQEKSNVAGTRAEPTGAATVHVLMIMSLVLLLYKQKSEERISLPFYC